jgi:exosortase
MYWILILLSVGYLWFRLMDNLLPEWMTNPQYGYGLLVPLLCIGLFIRRWSALGKVESRQSGGETRASVFFLFAILAFLYLPIRLIEAATPEWRIIQWLLGIVTIGLTLCVIRLGKGRGWLRQLMFPIVFFLVAIPWPTLIEAPIIQTLTRVSAATVAELLYFVGVPAIVHGNVIEIGTGTVGIEEACSGIRSFQTSLMTCLFLGEFYRLRPAFRWLLIPIGFGLAMIFNISRMFALTLIAAKKGVAAISQYHDPAGVSVAIFCTLGLWGLALFLSRKKNRLSLPPAATHPEAATTRSAGGQAEYFPAAKLHLNRLGLCLLIWLIVVEAGVQLWYHSRESSLNPGPAWTLNFPQDNPTLKAFPIDESTRNLLRYDEGKEAAWTDPDGTQWQAFCFTWLPGRVAGYLAKRHTPEICLPAIGLKLVSGPQLTVVNIHGVDLPIRSYVFANGDTLIQVFHCRWEAGANREAYAKNESARFNLVRAVWAGRGNEGQKVFEFVISGINDPQQARQALVSQLGKLVSVEKPPGPLSENH